jgi:hypothetical protein
MPVAAFGMFEMVKVTASFGQPFSECVLPHCCILTWMSKGRPSADAGAKEEDPLPGWFAAGGRQESANGDSRALICVREAK